jgi:hypothetical protein
MVKKEYLTDEGRLEIRSLIGPGAVYTVEATQLENYKKKTVFTLLCALFKFYYMLE